MDALVEETVVSTQSIIERSSPSQTMSSNVVSTSIAARSINSTATSQARANGTVVFTPPNQVKQAIAIPQPGGSVSIVHVAIPNNQPVHVQSVIQQPNQQSVIQAPGGTTTATLQTLPKNVILLNKLTGQGSVIHSADGDSGVHPVQLISAKSESDSETVTAVLSTTEDESKKRRELLARRPSYRKILSELSSTETHTAVATLGTATTATAELKDDGTTAVWTQENINAVMRPVSDFSSDQSNEETVVDDGEGGSTITVGGTQYHTSAGLLKVVPAGAIQLATQDATGNIQGLQTLTMSNAGGGATGTIVQYAQGGDGQFFVPVTVSAADLQAYGIRTTGNTGSSLGQSVVMTQSGTIQSPVHMVEEVSRKRELRLLKNREAAKECRRKKKEYIKCLENRVAVLENQNKALIEELKSLKDIYCQKND